MTNNADTSNREIMLTRLLDAPRELVWKVWTEPEHLARWWGPNGFTITSYEQQLKVGGMWRFMMHGPDGKDYPNRITFLEVVKPERLVYKHTDDEIGSIRFEVIVTFEKEGKKTRLTMKTIFESPAVLEKVVREYGAIEGGQQTISRLEQHLSSLINTPEQDRTIISQRTVQAPRELIWKAWTEPEYLAQWWGPNGFTNTFHLFELKPGGVWEFVMHGPDGVDYKNKSMFLALEAPSRIILDHISPPRFLINVTFEDRNGDTHIVFRQLFETAEECARIRVFAGPANEENFDRLEKVLERIKSR